MSDGAIMNLVRVLPLSSTLEADFGASPEMARHDEVRLMSPDGEPAAAPAEYTEDNLDYEFDYSSGVTGYALRGSRMRITVPVDFISGAVARKLEQWKRERAAVWLCPGFGRNSVFAWRACDIAGTSYLSGPLANDLTGQIALQSTCSAYLRYWHEAYRAFIPKTSANRAMIVSTPGGAGLLTHASTINRMVPAYPKSATLSQQPAASGWAAAGAASADISAAFVSNGFGVADCPSSLRVSVAANAAIDRYLFAAEQFVAGGNYAGYAFVNATPATAVVWLKGQLPDAAAIVFGHAVSGDYTLRSLAGVRFDGWTPIAVSHTPVAWATNPPMVWLQLGSATGIGCSFEIGPTMITQGGMPAAAVWSAQTTGGTVSGTAQIATTSALTLPGQGTLVASFYVPEDMSAAWRATEYCSIFANTNIRLRARASRNTEYFTLSSVSPSIATSCTSAPVGTYLIPGRVCTVAVTWDGASQKMYVNGALVMTSVTAATTVPIGGSSSVAMIGRDGGGYNCAPLALLTVRVDDGAMTASEVASEHVLLSDPGVTHLTVASRGRQFRVTGVPMSVRGAYGGSQVFGPLTLEQCDYQQHLADPWNKERSVG